MRNQGRRRDDKKSEEEQGAPMWMVTYGDLMSLLLTFFVLLVTFSSIQQLKFQKAMGSLKGSLGVLKYFRSPTEPTSLKVPRLRGYNTSKMEQKKHMGAINDEVQQAGLQNAIQIEERPDGILIRITESVLFESGRANLKTTSYEILAKIGKLVNSWPNRTKIVGHTDNVPIHTTQFPSNWELSAIRAISVLKFLLQVSMVQPEKIYYAGYGETMPLVPNNSVENRARNRRVEIFLERNPDEQATAAQTTEVD